MPSRKTSSPGRVWSSKKPHLYAHGRLNLTLWARLIGHLLATADEGIRPSLLTRLVRHRTDPVVVLPSQKTPCYLRNNMVIGQQAEEPNPKGDR